MSNARELALIEKWADIATLPTTTTLPPLSSPTSPKATPFCCCPNRRRYNLKTTASNKKSTLHARNIFIDNDFKYIDDVSQEHDSCGKSSVSSSSHPSIRRTRNKQAAVADETTNLAALEGYYSDYDDIIQVAASKQHKNNNNQINKPMSSIESIAPANVQAQHDKVSALLQQQQQNNCNINNLRADNCLVQAKTNNNTTNISKPKIGAVTNTISNAECLTTRAHSSENNEQSQQLQKQQQNLDEIAIQRLSNSTFSSKQTSATPAAVTSACQSCTNKENTTNNCDCNAFKLSIKHNSGDCSNCQRIIDNVPREKMTIATTTNVITNRKRSECSLTTAAATTEPSLPIAATTTPAATQLTLPLSTSIATTSTAACLAQSPTTPTKTVIKTVLVKRSPINEPTDMASSSPTATPSMRTWDKAGSEQPRYSVKERIAKLVAGNEQNQQKHDNSITYKTQCNTNMNATMTKISTESAIKTTSSQKQSQQAELHATVPNTQVTAITSTAATNQLLISNDKCTTSTATAAATTASTTTGNSTATCTTTSSSTESAAMLAAHSNNKLLQLNDDDIKLQRQMLISNNTGCATLPRSRTSNERCNVAGHNNCNSTSHSHSHNNKYGSNIGKTMTVFDKNIPSQNGDKNVSAHDVVVHATSASCSNANNRCDGLAASHSGKLSALDNLDLALSLELADDDGEDPYYALQEYLEKVKHEINEVFELHKARQRMQIEQTQQPLGDDGAECLANAEVPAADIHATEESELSTVLATAAELSTTTAVSSDELSRSIDSDSGFDSASATGNILVRSHNGSSSTSTSTSNNKLPTNDSETQITESTHVNDIKRTELKALPPPPLRVVATSTSNAAVKRLRSTYTGKHNNASSDEVHIWANKLLKDLDNLMSPNISGTASSSASSSPTSKTSPMLLSAAASAAIKSRYGPQRSAGSSEHTEQTSALVLRPAKHTTIPLQSFNLDCGRIDSCANATASATAVVGTGINKATIAYKRTLSAPGPYQQQAGYAATTHSKGNRNSLTAFNIVAEKQQRAQRERHNQQSEEPCLTNGESNAAATVARTATTILKIEETSGVDPHAANNEVTSQQRQLENDMETIRNALLEQTQQLSVMEAAAVAEAAAETTEIQGSTHSSGSAAMATLQPKRERINNASNASNTAGNSNGYLLASIDPMTKKGSTSTIWTSEESILRSVGAVDEDNNSTSSSACDEATGVLSSGKSGISLDSSGLDNDNNESGIGTATPPKDMFYWKTMHHHQQQNNDNESVSSFDALRKIKFVKSSSVASSDDPDLLEVLSLCGETQAPTENDNLASGAHLQQKQIQAAQATSRQNNSTAVLELDDMPATGNPEEHANDADEDDEGHDEFETITYCDCDYTDGEVSSASGNSCSHKRAQQTKPTQASVASVVLRRKCNAGAAPIMVSHALKCRSHSLDTASLPNAYQHHQPLTRKLHHLQHGRAKDRVQLSLALRQEPFQSLLAPTHFHELPSPSSASLHSGHESIGMQELTTKSNSAPLLLKQEKKRDDFTGQKLTLRYSRSQSDRYLAEIEAVEACKWLRAAGFPQYAQMYEDHQFPIDLTNVAKDHTNLENDQLQSLYRRLCILNRCANMRLDQSHKPQTPQQKEDSDDENFALSENWTFQPHIRRWSRIGEMGLELPPATKLNVEKTESSSKESSPDRFEDDDDDQYDLTGAGLSLILPAAAAVGVAGAGGAATDDSADATLNESADAAAVRLRRTGSERLKDGAKALLRRVESIKSRRRKRQNREGIVISGPQALDLSQLGQRHSSRKPDAVYSTPPSPSAVSPMHTFPKSPFFGNELKVPSQSDNFLHPNRTSPKRTPTTPRSMRTSPLHFFQMPHLKEGKSDDSSSYYSDSQESSTGGKLTLRKPTSKARRFLQRTGKVDDIGTHSDSECHQGRKLLIKDANANNTEVTVKKLHRGGSLNLGKDPKKREGVRSSSFRSRSTTRKENISDETEGVKRSPVVRWHSFQMEERPNMIFRKCFSQKLNPNCNEHGVPFAAMSAGQLQIIRKLALVILTGYMERYCPTHRSGWNWELPKFIKKIKMPDYRDKRVFGVPLMLILQRTGQTLPVAVRSAFRWLQLNALDQIGLFRKSGVKSRILKLKELIEYSESTTECMDVFDTQQAYDVADMLKQYFRDLPESLLTTKMSETFAAIFQHLPPEVRLDAVQCAVLLLPDENREILYALLEFLTLVAANSSYNQMTTNNLAVCLAPSLFHSSISTGAASVSASPRRRGKGTGVPDAKELSEAKASHECLSFMIDHYKQIYTASKDRLGKCNFGYMEESKPVPLEALGEGMHFHNWRGYLYECTSATIKEGREKTRGWFTINSSNDPQVEIAFKKVGDGHPLRLWRCITEIEGPPKEVLDYIIRQRASWDGNLLQCQTVKKLDERTEIYYYALDGQFTTDFCVLRSWQTDLPRGACVIVETSIDHAKAKPMFGAIRGVVLASRYLIEPCGSGRSRVMHLARVDIKGKTPEWYNKSYGHICSHYLSKIRLAFKNVADGPESKV